MLELQCNIIVGSWSFNYVTDLRIDEVIDKFTRTAFIRLPQRFYDDSSYDLFDTIGIGDNVVISLGYYPNLELRFTGYVSKRVPNSPLDIYCEDESWKYKQKILDPVTLEDTTIGEFIKAVYPGTLAPDSVFDPTRKIGTWRVAQSTTFLKVLDTLRTTFGTSAYWDNFGRLYIDRQFGINSALAGNFFYDDNRRANIISLSNMTYQDAKEFSQVVRGVSQSDQVDANNKPLPPVTVFSFYNDAGVITSTPEYTGDGNINMMKIPYLTYTELKKLTESRLKNLNFTGFRGSFMTFGEPLVNINDDVQIINERQKEMNGRYRVRGLNTTFGVNGYRQQIEVSKKVGIIDI